MRLRGWERRHWRGADVALAAGLAFAALGELVAGREWVEGPWLGQLVAFLVMTGAVALRRQAVVVAATVCGAGLVAQELLGPAPAASGFLALLVVAYSGGAHGAGRAGVAALIVLLAALTVYPVTEPAARTPADLVGNLAIFLGAWGLGRLVRHQRQRESALATAHAQLATAHARLAAGQRRERAVALVAERTRIARDLHDIVAHGVSLMVLQAGAARAVLDTQPDLARDPLLAVETSGRKALDDLHRMLGLLRAEESGEPPDLGALPELIESLAGSGLLVDLRTVGGSRALEPDVSRCAYRVVQEGLTNVLKHAQGTHAEVVVVYTASGVRVEVLDVGGGVGRPADLPASGFGLTGLRERVAHHGGTVHASAQEAGWRLVAEIPCASESASGGLHR